MSCAYARLNDLLLLLGDGAGKKKSAYPVQNKVAVTPPQPTETHRHPALDVTAAVDARVVLDDALEVAGQELEHHVDVVAAAHKDVQQVDDVVVPQLLQELDLPQRVHRDALRLGRDLDLFDGHRLPCGLDMGPVDDGVRSFANLVIYEDELRTRFGTGQGGSTFYIFVTRLLVDVCEFAANGDQQGGGG